MNNIEELLLNPSVQRDTIGYLIPGLFFLSLVFLFLPTSYLILPDYNFLHTDFIKNTFITLVILCASYVVGMLGSATIMLIFYIFKFWVYKPIKFFIENRKYLSNAIIRVVRSLAEKDEVKLIRHDGLILNAEIFHIRHKIPPIMSNYERYRVIESFWRSTLGLSLYGSIIFWFLQPSFRYFFVIICVISLFAYFDQHKRLQKEKADLAEYFTRQNTLPFNK